MMTSVTGLQSKTKYYQQGFTLLEIMIVVVIMAALMTTISFTVFSDNAQKRLDEESERLVAALQWYGDEAQFAGREYGIKFEKDHYRIMQFDAAARQWIDSPEQGVAVRYDIPEELTIELAIEGVPWIEQDDIEWESDQRGDEERFITPQIFIMSSGDITAFRAQFTWLADNKRFQRWLVVDFIGNVTLSDEEPK